MKYIHIYNTKSEYNAISEKEHYDMSLIRNEDNRVIFLRNYYKEYFTIEAINNGTFSVVVARYIDKSNNIADRPESVSITYSINNNEWSTLTLNSSNNYGFNFNVSAGDTIRFKSTNTMYCNSSTNKGWHIIFGYSNNNITTQANDIYYADLTNFISSAMFNVYGNIMSLLYGDNFIGQTSLGNNNFTFCSIFKLSSIVSAKNLILPAMTLKSSCYRAMFSKAYRLKVSPTFPAKNLTTECYKFMFEGCINLKKITCLAESGMTPGSETSDSALAAFTKSASGIGSLPSSGIFIKSPNISYSSSGSSTSWSRGDNGIPSGWVVKNYTE